MSAQSLTQVTVLFADLSGFTALTETHGDVDAAEVVARLYALAQKSLSGEARLIKTIGDAVMIVAAEPQSAVATAFELVVAVQHEPGFPALRAGLHLGPCIERAGDYFGTAVNLAARVAAYARSDQVLGTEAVADAVRSLGIARLRLAGSARFKNVSRPITLFQLEDPRHPPAPSEIDPVCCMRLDPECAPARLPFGERTYYFCSLNCAQKFMQAPDVYTHA